MVGFGANGRVRQEDGPEFISLAAGRGARGEGAWLGSCSGFAACSSCAQAVNNPPQVAVNGGDKLMQIPEPWRPRNRVGRPLTPCRSHKFSIPVTVRSTPFRRAPRAQASWERESAPPDNVLTTWAFRPASHRAAGTPEPAPPLTKALDSKAHE